nr:hypothetical protein [Chlamydiota bacterium]
MNFLTKLSFISRIPVRRPLFGQRLTLNKNRSRTIISCNKPSLFHKNSNTLRYRAITPKLSQLSKLSNIIFATPQKVGINPKILTSCRTYNVSIRDQFKWIKSTFSNIKKNVVTPLPSSQSNAPQSSDLKTTIENALSSNQTFSLPLEELIVKIISKDSKIAKNLNLPIHDMVKKWIRNASTYIFQDPLRSFLELILNSYDAQNPDDQPIGRFGMGFFSIFYFLTHKETDGCIIELKTRYLEDGKLKGYQITFEKNESIELTFFPLSQEELKNGPGTDIKILPINSSFSEETLRKLREYTFYVDFQHKGKLFLNDNLSDPVAIGHAPETQKPPIQVDLTSQELRVSDHGTGIPLDIALRKLLIPSSTTKKFKSDEQTQRQALRETSSAATLTRYRGKSDPNQSHFIVTVDDVVVMNIPLLETLLPPQDWMGEDACDLLLTLKGARLITSRDEVLIDENGSSFEEQYIKKVITETVQACVDPNNSNVSRVLAALYRGLQAWETRTAASHLSGRFTGHLKNELGKLLKKHPEIIPIDPNVYPQLTSILDGQSHFLPLEPFLAGYNYNRLEKWIRFHFHEKVDQTVEERSKQLQNLALNGYVIDGMPLYIVDDRKLPKTPEGTPLITKLGLPNTLFCPASVLDEVLKSNTQDLGALRDRLVEAVIFRYHDHDGVLPPYMPTEGQNLAQASREEGAVPASMGKYLLYVNPGEIPKPRDDFESAIWYNCLERGFVNHLHKKINVLSDVPNGVLKQFWNEYVSGRNRSEYCLEDIYRWPSRQRFLFKKSTVIKQVVYLMTHLIILKKNNKQKYKKLKTEFNTIGEKIYYGEDGQLYECDLNAINKAFEYVLNGKIPTVTFQDKKVYEMNEDEWKEYKAKEKKIVEYITATFEKKGSIESCFKSISPKPFINFLFLELLIYYRLYPSEAFLEEMKAFYPTRNYNDRRYSPKVKSSKQLMLDRFQFEKTAPFLAVGNEVLWPLPKDKPVTAQHLLRVLGAMLFDRNREYYIEFGLGLDFEPKNLPGEDQDPVLRAIKQREVRTAPMTHIGLKPERLKDMNVAFCELSFAAQHEINLNTPGIVQTVMNVSHPLIMLEQDDRLTDSQQAEIRAYRHALWYLYDQALNIDPGTLNASYGENKLNIHTESKHSDELTLLLMRSLVDDPASFSRVIDLSLQFWEQVVGTEAKLGDRVERTKGNGTIRRDGNEINIPFSKCPHVSMNILSRLLSKGVPKDVVTLLLRRTKTLEELTYVAYLLDSIEDISLLAGGKEKTSTILFTLDLFIKEFIQKHMLASEIQAWCRGNVFDFVNLLCRPSRIKELGSFCQLENFLRESKQKKQLFKRESQFLPDEIKQLIGQNPSFGLKQLIEAVFQDPEIESKLQNGSLYEVVEIVRRTEGDLDLNRVTQCVESTTERPAIGAVLTEWLQNSVDEIKKKQKAEGYKIEDKSRLNEVEFDVKVVKDRQLCLEIQDHVGMKSLATLLEFLIPDHSRKSQDSIGVMGNGLFKMYQKAQQVVVTIRLLDDPDKVYMVTIVPIRDSGKVVDLQLRWIDVSEKVDQHFVGTKIQLLFQGRDPDATTIDAIWAQHYLMETIGAAQLADGRQPIRLYLKNDQGKCALLNSIEKKKEDGIYNSSHLTVRRLHRREMPSAVTTAGIPFIPLVTLCEQYKLVPPNLLPEITRGIVVDLPKGAYQPVNSRTKLKLKPEVVEELRVGLANALYLAMFEKAQKKKKSFGYKEGFNHLFPFFNSNGSASSIGQFRMKSKPKFWELYDQNCHKGEFFNRQLFMTHFKPQQMQEDAIQSFHEILEKVFDAIIPEIDSHYGQIYREFSEMKSKARDELDGSDEKKEQLREEMVQRKDEWISKMSVAFNKKLSECISELKGGNLLETIASQVVVPWFKKKLMIGSLPFDDLDALIQTCDLFKTTTEKQVYENEKDKTAEAIEKVQSPGLDLKKVI